MKKIVPAFLSMALISTLAASANEADELETFKLGVQAANAETLNDDSVLHAKKKKKSTSKSKKSKKSKESPKEDENNQS